MQCQICYQYTHSMTQVASMLPSVPSELVQELYDYQFTHLYYCDHSNCFAFICEGCSAKRQCFFCKKLLCREHAFACNSCGQLCCTAECCAIKCPSCKKLIHGITGCIRCCERYTECGVDGCSECVHRCDVCKVYSCKQHFDKHVLCGATK